jgi:hypothetical protein
LLNLQDTTSFHLADPRGTLFPSWNQGEAAVCSFMRAQGMSEDINVRIAGQVTSEGLVIGWAFVHCNLLDALSAHRAIATHQIEEDSTL